MTNELAYEIFSLGDAALTIDLGNRICSRLNQKAIGMQQFLLQHPFEGIKDLILGYSSLTILYDPFLIQTRHKPKCSSFEFVKAKIADAFLRSTEETTVNGVEIPMPVCYDQHFGADLSHVASVKGLEIEDVINLHLSKTYRVYMMGFLPGFAYMGEVDERIQLPRKLKPEPVTAGSVGIASGQTGIYPLDSPGGWHIIGRTPVKLFNQNAEQPVKLKTGQSVRFYRISSEEFENLKAAEEK